MQHHYAAYSLKATEGTLGKSSNNPAEQNHASIVHWVGEKLYEEPAYEIKQLLGRQRTLEDKRNGEKAEYHFKVQVLKSTNEELLADPQLTEAISLLDEKSYERWKEQRAEAVHYSVSVDENGNRSFIRTGKEHSPRTLIDGARCNCSFRVQYLMQWAVRLC